MVKRNNRVKIVFILVCFSGMFAFNQEKQVDEDKNKKLREEILAVYNSGGEQGLTDFFKRDQGKITNKFIGDFAKTGLKERKEEWLKICKIIAEEKKDEKTLADVLYNTGIYFRLISNYKKAAGYFDQALPIYQKLNDLVGIGSVNFRKGLICFQVGENKDALEMYDKALSFFKKANVPIGQANVYLAKGNIYLGINENTKALDMYDKAILLYNEAGSLIGQGNVYFHKGDIYINIGDNPKAFEMYEKALPFFEKAKEPMGQGGVFARKGDIYSRVGDNYKALEMYDKALTIFEKIGALNNQGNIYESKGSIYLTMGDNLKAFAMYDKALVLFERAGEPIGQGNIYWRRGNIYLTIGENSKALEMYDKALPFFEKAGQLIGQGNIYWRRGDIYFRTGENLKALEMYEKAMSFFESAGQFVGQGNVYMGKGNIYFRTGENSRALEMYDKALSFFEKAGQPIGQGNVFLKKGLVFFNIGKNSKALEMYDKALTFYEIAGQVIGQGNVYMGKGEIYLRMGENSKALEMMEKALPLFKKSRYTTGQGNLYAKKGEIYFYTGNYSKSLEMYDKALFFLEKAGNVLSESIALYGKAKLLLKKGKRSEALTHFDKAIAKLEKVRRQTAFSELKRTFMEKVYDQYEETVLFMLENIYYEKGFKYAESMRGRVFLDQINEEFLGLEKGLEPDLREERDRLVGKLSALTRQMQEIGIKDEKKLQELKDEYHQVESQFEDLLIKIRLENPLYAAVSYPQPVTVRDLQTDVLKKGEILLSYFISQEKAYAFIVSRKKLRVKQLKVKEKEINSHIERYLQSIKENNTNDMNRFGSVVYEKLFKPLEKYLKKGREIIIVPSGKLEKIPFESLIVSKKKSGYPVYLLENYRMKYLQSASLLSILRKHYTRESPTKGFIGFGDPVYDYENFKQGKPEQGSMKILATESTEITENSSLTYSPHSPYSPNSPEDEIKDVHRDRYARAGGIMDRLPHSGEEIKTIARLFEKESLKSVTHLREQAVEDNAKAANMKDFDYIHFSCHGLLSDDFQSLVLSGYFTLNEIMNCDYNAKLVVLSACETGSGKMYKGEGVTGLTRAVMYAGTPAVIASLWKVDDIATKELMVKFYKNLLERDLDKTEALRQAKLELIKNKKYRSPLFWSAFVMYGE
jgi:CHAT domain-containing protein/Tfp pilus assembly protein PilF